MSDPYFIELPEIGFIDITKIIQICITEENSKCLNCRGIPDIVNKCEDQYCKFSHRTNIITLVDPYYVYTNDPNHYRELAKMINELSEKRRNKKE